MKVLAKLCAVGLFLVNVGCDSEIRDTLVGGALDFFSGTITDSMTAAAPVADWIAALWGG